MIGLSISGVCGTEPEPNSLVLAGEPILSIEKNGTGTLSYKTLFPTPPGRLYYGTALPEQRLDYPRYRYTASEKGGINRDTGLSELSIEHKITFPVGRMENYFGDSFKGSMVVHYRLEVYHPQAKQSRFFDRRFRYEKADDGTYRKAVCIIEGPFIDCIEGDRALISWTCDEPVQGCIQIRDRGKTKMHLGQAETPKQKHEIEIDGLKADTKYQYRVVYGPQINDMSGWTKWFTFQTAPKLKSKSRVLFCNDVR